MGLYDLFVLLVPGQSQLAGRVVLFELTHWLFLPAGLLLALLVVSVLQGFFEVVCGSLVRVCLCSVLPMRLLCLVLSMPTAPSLNIFIDVALQVEIVFVVPPGLLVLASVQFLEQLVFPHESFFLFLDIVLHFLNFLLEYFVLQLKLPVLLEQLIDLDLHFLDFLLVLPLNLALLVLILGQLHS